MAITVVYDRKSHFLRELACFHLRGQVVLCNQCQAMLIVALTPEEARIGGKGLGVFCPEDQSHLSMEVEPGDIAFALAPLVDELARLPLRAVVALAVRAARRVQHFYDAAAGDNEGKALISTTLNAVEEFCTQAQAKSAGDYLRMADEMSAVEAEMEKAHNVVAADTAAAVSRCAHAARYAEMSFRYISGSQSEEKHARLSSAAAAATGGAARAVSDETAVFMRNDFEVLMRMDLGEYPDLGGLIDPSEAGPLGPVWPNGRPAAGITL